MKKFLIVLVIALIPAAAFANFAVQFENTFDKKMYYFLYWIDHPYNWPGPFHMAGGELDPSEKLNLDAGYQSGTYRVVWRDRGQWRNEITLKIDKNVIRVTIRPEKIEY